MHYVYLVIGILTEICGSTLLKFTDGFQKKFLAALCLLAYGVALLYGGTVHEGSAAEYRLSPPGLAPALC